MIVLLSSKTCERTRYIHRLYNICLLYFFPVIRVLLVLNGVLWQLGDEVSMVNKWHEQTSSYTFFFLSEQPRSSNWSLWYLYVGVCFHADCCWAFSEDMDLPLVKSHAVHGYRFFPSLTVTLTRQQWSFILTLTWPHLLSYESHCQCNAIGLFLTKNKLCVCFTSSVLPTCLLVFCTRVGCCQHNLSRS